MIEIVGKMEEEMMTTPSEKLLPEMWMEIFSRLPAKNLAQLRCVSTTWRSIIDNPDFISLHISQFKNNIDKHFLLSFETEPTFDRENEYVLRIGVRTMGKFRKRELILWHTYISDHYHLDYRGYVDGLVLFGRLDQLNYSLILFNPSIQKCRVLPESPPCPGGRLNSIIGFDPVSNDYKVVVIKFPFRLPEHTYPDCIMVYELSTGVWRVNVGVEVPERWCLEQKVYTKGFTHWIALDREIRPLPKNYTHIISFDFVSETFSYTELPGDRTDDVEKVTCPFVLGDALAVLDVYRDALNVSRAHVCIWVMKKRGGSGMQSWSEWYHKTTDSDTFVFIWQQRFRCKNLVYVECLHKLLLEVSGQVKSFDLESLKLKDLDASHCRYSFDPYVESLLLCKGFNDFSNATSMEENNGQG